MLNNQRVSSAFKLGTVVDVMDICQQCQPWMNNKPQTAISVGRYHKKVSFIMTWEYYGGNTGNTTPN